MFRLFRYIIFFLLGYKVLKMLFAEEEQPARSRPQQPADNNNAYRPPQSPPPPPPSRQPDKFESAETIEFEELK